MGPAAVRSTRSTNAPRSPTLSRPPRSTRTCWRTFQADPFPMKIPDERDAQTLVERALGGKVTALDRFAHGLCHYVYDVTLQDGRRVVARLAGPESKKYLAAGVYWQQRLKPLGVPLPALLHADLDGATPHV